jgi:hypothetical protein
LLAGRGDRLACHESGKLSAGCLRGQAHQVAVEAAPIMYVAQLLGGTTEQAIRWLILAIVLCCDPLAIALTGGGFGSEVRRATK